MKEPLLPETVYHIYNHANGSENLFRTEDNYRYFLNKYAIYIHPIAETYAYCLMPNHFHVMIKIRTKEVLTSYFNQLKQNRLTKDLQGFENLEGLISQQFSNLFNGYTKAYNKMFKRMGSLFMPNFKRKAITNDQYFTQLIAYIHLNPIKHGFCNNLFDWPHSSIHSYLSKNESKLNKSYLEEWFGSKESMLKFHQELVVAPSISEDL
jgi:REP element-mobilizing transposase RayT